MSWGISDKATEKEKIFAEFSDCINGFNCAGKIDYDAYSQIYDFGRTLADREYEQGKADGVDECINLIKMCCPTEEISSFGLLVCGLERLKENRHDGK